MNGITLSSQSPGVFGKRKNSTAKINPIKIEDKTDDALTFHLKIFEITDGPNADPIAVQANKTLVKIFSGIMTAINADDRITNPVTKRDTFNESLWMFKSILIDDEQTNIWLSAVDIIADITAASKTPWIAGWKISSEILKNIFSLLLKSVIIKCPAIPKSHIPVKTMQNQIRA